MSKKTKHVDQAPPVEQRQRVPFVNKATDIKEIPIKEIVSNSPNPRNSAPILADMGYGFFAKREGSNKPALVPLALSADPNDRAEYVKIIETVEPELAEVGQSLAVYGQLQNAIVRPVDDGFQLVVGMRRMLASLYNSCKNGWEPTLACVIRDISDAEVEFLAFEENFRRKQMNYIEEAKWFQAMKEAGMKPKEISEKTGIDHQTVRGRISLLGLSEEKQAAVADGSLPYVKAQAILKGKANTSDPRATTRGGKGGKGGAAAGARRRVPTLSDFQKMYEEREGLHEKVREFLATEILEVEYKTFKEIQKMKADLAEKEAAKGKDGE